MNTIKLLFTGIGRRVELIQAFRKAANTEDIDLKIYGADCSSTAPALCFCDYARITSHMKSEGYIDELIEICHKDQIDLVIPTIDTDLLALSQNKNRFGNTKVLISSEEVIKICRDKYQTSIFFKECLLNTPKTYRSMDDYDGGFPCFIKPINGSSSLNANKVINKRELQVCYDRGYDFIIQSVIEGTEYTVDVFCDFDSNPVFITPRIRTQVRSGEVIKTEIDLDEKIIEECKIILRKLRPVGPLAIQLIRTAAGEDVFIEINGRFGGGAPLSMRAGADSAREIIRLLAGKQADVSSTIENHVVFSRYEQSMRVSQSNNLRDVQGVIFDLDDTLYSEKQYVHSGFKAVADYLNDDDAEQKLWGYFEAGLPAIDALLDEMNIPEKKEACLDAYREHNPAITPYDGVAELIRSLKKQGKRVGIITDGRVSGQRKKISALGLNKIVDDIIITDELGGTQFRKPNDISFRIMQRRWEIPFEKLVYIGDNVAKDISAPRQLGMNYIWLHNPDGLYTKTESLDNSINIKSALSCLLFD